MRWGISAKLHTFEWHLLSFFLKLIQLTAWRGKECFELNPLDAYNDTEFISRYRITRGIFIQLHEKIVRSLLRYTIRSHPIPILIMASDSQLNIDYGK